MGKSSNSEYADFYSYIQVYVIVTYVTLIVLNLGKTRSSYRNKNKKNNETKPPKHKKVCLWACMNFSIVTGRSIRYNIYPH